MTYKSDIEIAQEAKIKHIKDIADKVGLTEDDLEYYGKYKAKIDYKLLERYKDKEMPSLYLQQLSIQHLPVKENYNYSWIGRCLK